MQKINVLHILWSGRAGGAERCVRDIVSYSDVAKFYHCVCFLSEGGIIAEQIRRLGGKVVVLNMKHGFDVLAGLKVLWLLKDMDIRLVHVHTRTYFINALLCMFSGRTIRIYFEHGGHLVGDHPKRELFFYKLFGAFFKVVLTNSEYVRNKVLRNSNFPGEKVKTFYIGIDSRPYGCSFDKNEIKKELHIPLAHEIVGIVGRLAVEKGMDDFIKAAVEIRKRRNAVSFVIVGDGEKRGDLEQLAKSLAIDIIFLGERNDVSRLLKIFDLFLFTSRWESFGIVIVEAMAAKIPIVGFPVPGADEIFRKGGLESLLTKTRDVEQLAILACRVLSMTEGEISLIRDKELRNVENNFNILKAVESIQIEYSNVLNNP